MHIPVLLNEIVSGLNLEGKGKSSVLDGTFGGGGHSREICRKHPGIKVIALDQDKSVWSEDSIAGCDISFHPANFRDLDKVLEEESLAQVDGIIFDLGFSSDQLEKSGRGFSFMKDEPLLMTYKSRLEEDDLTAEEIVNTWSEDSLEKIIRGYGEERYARRIARAIAERRKAKAIATTRELLEVLEKAVPVYYQRGKLHFATRTFQALRIAVNDELGALEEGLKKGWQALAGGGRMAVISFHSLEDRIVKNFFKEKAKDKTGVLINKKPIVPANEELKTNPRARSAKLRIIEKSINEDSRIKN